MNLIDEQLEKSIMELDEQNREKVQESINHFVRRIVRVTDQTKSPIEEDLAMEIIESIEGESEVGGSGVYLVHPQALIELPLNHKETVKYYVDFLITWQSFPGRGQELKFVIECDGHEFHERTKEQAKKDRRRDRKLIQHGYIPLRFTGQEIYEDAQGCSMEIMDVIKAHANDLSV